MNYPINLPNDVSRCLGHDCKLSDNCQRHLGILVKKPISNHTPVSENLSGGFGDCQFYIEFKKT